MSFFSSFKFDWTSLTSSFRSFLLSSSPLATVHASETAAAEEEEELVDPQDVLREQCKTEHCQSFVDKLEACNTRVSSKKQTTETCYEELIDFMHCVDHCASQTLFAKLK